MYEEWVQEQVQIAMSFNNPLKDETQHGFPPGSGSQSSLLALLVKLRQLRIAIALLGRQMYGVGRLP